MGEEDERQKALAAIRGAVGEEAGRLPTIVEEKGGFYLGVTEGLIDDFASLNDLSAQLSGLITSGSTIAFRVMPAGARIRDDFGSGRTLSLHRPGATGVFQGVVTAHIVESTGSGPGVAAVLMSDRRPGLIDAGILAAHELGHAAFLQDMVWASIGSGSKAARGRASDATALLFENMVRRERSPAGPIRKLHH